MYLSNDKNCTKNSFKDKVRLQRNFIISSKITFIYSSVLGAFIILSPCASAQNQPNTGTELPSALFPKITVIAEVNNPPSYAGEQVSYVNHLGLLGDKDFLETPFNTISYTEKFIKDTQATEITYIITHTDPSVYSSNINGQNLEYYNIRGFTQTANDVSVSGLYGIAPYYRSTPEMYEQVEVLKGPSAMLNGMAPTGSVGGTVNLVPKRANDIPLTQVTASYLSDSQLGGHVDIGRRFGDDKQFGVRFNGVYRDGDTTTDKQTQETQFASLALDYRGDNMRASLDAYDSQEYVNAPTRGIQLAPNVPLPKLPNANTSLNPTWAYNDSHDKGLMLQGDYDISDNITAYAKVGRSKTEFESQSASRATVINEAGDYTTSLGEVADDWQRDAYEIGVRSDFKTGAINHQLAVNTTKYKEDHNLNARFLKGLDVTTNIYNPVWPAFNEPLIAPALVNTKTDLTSYGIADTLSFADDKYQLTLGIRHQQVEVKQTGLLASGNDYDESATTPSVAFLAKLNDNTSIYGNYIEGLSQGATAPATAANAGETFAPYKTKQKEIGIKYDMGEFAHTLSLFEIKKPISYLDPSNNVFSFNGEQRNRGIEWGFFGTPISDVTLMGGVTYIDAEQTKGRNEGKQAVAVPKWQGKLGVEWAQPYVSNLTLTANATAVAEQYIDANNDVSIPSYTLLDVGARYETHLGQYPMTLRGVVKNVADKSYWAKPYYQSLGIGEPRTAMLSATIDF